MVKKIPAACLIVLGLLILNPRTVLAGGSPDKTFDSPSIVQGDFPRAEIHIDPIEIRLSGDLLAGEKHESIFTLVINFIEAISHLAWPTVAVFFLILYKDGVNKILSKVKKLIIFGQKVELEEDIKELEEEVQEAKGAIPTQDPSQFEASETLMRRKIIEESERSPVSAIIVLASEIERTAREVLAGSGWLQEAHKMGVRQNFRSLIEKKRIPESIYSSFDLFWQIRNRVVHGIGTNNIPQKELMKIIDIGLTLLNTLNAIPRERHYVKEAEISLFSDPDCTQLIEGARGIMLKNMAPGGVDMRVQLFPTTKIGYYQAGQEVSWEWSFYNTWKDTWYIDTESSEKRLAWNSSAEFIGRHMNELGEK